MRNLIKRIISFVGLKKIFIHFHVALRYFYNKIFANKNKLAIGERNIYCIPYEWITVDEYGAELNVNFEIEDTFINFQNKIDFIYSAHVFEHVSDEGLMSTFKKLKKNLNKGCVIRVEVPDVQIVIDDFLYDKKIYNEIGLECMNDMKLRRPGRKEYQQDHLGFVGMISCYKENDLHIPVLIDYDELVKICKTKDYDYICHKLISLQTSQQINTHGHINYFYEEKLSKLLTSCGFIEIQKCEIGVTYNKFPLNIERKHRSHFSLIMEGVYQG